MNIAATFSLPPSIRARTVTAVLGPTNTGKTHLAIERMLAHPSGLIGLPLRLLAREVYQKIADRVGAHAVALVTGEERLMPKAPRYFVSTVEAMPRETKVDFVAIDEIQIAGDLERGHVFTDRILNLRGQHETLLLGAETARGLIERLLPGVHVVTRPRLSMLTYAGSKKITRLPARSATVAFSTDEVYAIAELIRRQRGGAAVVMGALSPRTRNAQVELFQNGDVDFLVATDAIGMGLNLDVDHVAFAGNRKFDGYQYRQLTPAEMGQIAGRAGRYTRDGTFGVTGRVDPFEDDLVRRLESHAFDPVRVLQWRNPQLDFSSLDALRHSLSQPPREEGLTRAPPADDERALDFASRDDDVRMVAVREDRVRLLWDVCQVPDYRKIAPANHAELVSTVYQFVARLGAIPDDWLARQVAQADRREGDIDTLSNRIAHIRTWTYLANRADWLKDPAHWRERTRSIEDGLSDALHERLTQRFVDRRTSVLMRRLRENAMLEATISKDGDVLVEGHKVGHLTGFTFEPDVTENGQDAKAVRGAAEKALASEIEARAERLSRAPNPDIVLASDGLLRWIGEPVARLTASQEALRPTVTLIADEQLTGPARDKVQARLDLWVKAHLELLLKPLIDLRDAQDLEGIARGVAYQLVEAMGVLERTKVGEDIKALDQTMRASLRKYGVRFGAYHVFVPALLKPGPASLIALLWALKDGSLAAPGRVELAHMSASGRTSIKTDASFAPAFYRIFGFKPAGERAVRIDILERLADQIRPLIAWKPLDPTVSPPPGAVPQGGGFIVTVEMTSLLGASGDDMSAVLKALGYRMEKRQLPKTLVPHKPTAKGAAAAAPAPVTASEPAPASEPAREAEPIAAETAIEPVSAEPLAAEPVMAEPMAMETAPEPVAAEPVGEASAEAIAAEPMAVDAPEAVEAPVAAAPVEVELVEVEVWRPGRPGGHRDGHRGDRPKFDRAGGEQREGQRPPRGDRPRFDRPQGDRPRGDRPAEGGGDGKPQGEGGRQRFDKRFDAKPQGGGPRRDGDQQRRFDGPKGDQRPPRGDDRGPKRDQVERPKREVKIDPDSPFAKLAALKAQLEKKS